MRRFVAFVVAFSLLLATFGQVAGAALTPTAVGTVALTSVPQSAAATADPRTQTPTRTPTAPPTATTIPTATATPTVAATPTATAVPPTATPDPTSTPASTATATAILAPTYTPTVPPTNTPAATPTASPVPTNTPTVVATVAASPTATLVASPTATVLPTGTATAVATPGTPVPPLPPPPPGFTPVASPTVTLTVSPTSTPTVSPTPTAVSPSISSSGTSGRSSTYYPAPAAGTSFLPRSAYAGLIQPNDSILLLNVPYRTQFDGSLWQGANCGPASIGTVLEAYGIGVSTQHLRDLANQLQGTSGYRDGTALETLRAIARQYGLQTSGPGGSSSLTRWTTDDIRRQIARGWPVVTLVRYRSLPWNSASTSPSLHYIVVVGTTGQGFFVHDVGAAGGGVGTWRVLYASDLVQAWSDSGYPGLGIAFGPPAGQLGLATARLLGSEFLGSSRNVFFGASQVAPVGVQGGGAPAVDAPLPPAFQPSLAEVDVAPLLPLTLDAPLTSFESGASALPSSATLSSATPSQLVRTLTSRIAAPASALNITRLAPALSDRWSHPLLAVRSSQIRGEATAPSDLALSAERPDPTLVLSSDNLRRTDHSLSVVLLITGLGAAMLLVRRIEAV